MDRAKRLILLFSKFRTKLALLVLLPIIPALALALHRNADQRDTEKARVSERINNLARLIAANEAGFVKNARQLFASISEYAPLVLGTNQAFSEVHFQNLLKLSPDYLNFGLIETNGMLFASAVRPSGPDGENVYLGDRSYFRRTMKSGRFSIGDFQVGRLTEQPGLNFGYPIFNAEGNLARVMFGSLKLSVLREAAVRISLPDGAAATILDRAGTVLARLPEAGDWIGESHLDVPFVRDVLRTQEGLVESEGLDRTKRLYAVSSITDGESPSLYVSVGIPSDLLFAEANRTALRSFGIMAVVTVIALGVASLLAERSLVRPVRDLVAAANRVADADLKARAHVSESTAELHELSQTFNRMAASLERRAAEIEEANQTIRQMNLALEKRVSERTAELTEANRELEAFSYSVSHDLRAPLRHLDGFAQLLKRDQHERLDQKGLRHLDVISESARRMGTLIDELLVFSRMGRQEMLRTEIDTNRMVREIAGQLQEQAQSQQVESTVADLPKVHADPAMLKQVWVNLLSNAIKYSRPRAVARIEIGCCDEGNGEHIFFVRDNGVGFDMRYANKLFGVFQRLHTDAEFEGTGIGLANVRRIVTRHRGRTWAESKPGEGATIYFSLPKNEHE